MIFVDSLLHFYELSPTRNSGISAGISPAIINVTGVNTVFMIILSAINLCGSDTMFI